MRMLVALLFHAPGLRLFYGHRLAPRDFRSNIAAVGATLIAMLGAYGVLGGYGAAAAFAVGHVLWGVYLAVRVSGAPASTASEQSLGPREGVRADR